MCEGLSELLGAQGPSGCRAATGFPALLGTRHVLGAHSVHQGWRESPLCGVLSIHSRAVREHAFPRTPFSKPCHLEGLGTEIPWILAWGGSAPAITSGLKFPRLVQWCVLVYVCVCVGGGSLVQDFEMPRWGEEEAWRQGWLRLESIGKHCSL